MYADRQLERWLEPVRAHLPGLEVVDCHLHLGLTDPAGYQATGEELLDSWPRSEPGGAVFPVAATDGYQDANDAVLALAADHPDRLVPFAASTRTTTRSARRSDAWTVVPAA